MKDRGAIDESDPTSMHRAVELALGRCPARFAELVWAWALSPQPPAEEPEFVSQSFARAPDLPVL